MRAITLEGFEAGPTLRDLPVPEPGPTEVLVRVHASSVNGMDAAVASGMLKGMMEYEFPVTLGRDFAGVVERVGSGVTRYSQGDEVFGFLATPTLHEGSWAECVLVPEDMFLSRKPATLGFAEAGALPLAGVAALTAVESVNPSEGDRVLIVGACGGVGGYAVQLAAARGAHVIGTTTAEDEPRLRDLGAAETIDFRQQDVVSVVRERYPDGVEGLIDVVKRSDGFAANAELVRSGGRAASTVGAADVEALAERGVTATNVVASPEPAVLARLAEIADAGGLTVTIQDEYRLEAAEDALRAFAESGTRGKVALAVR
jgi:NADPH:quinone reductase-like Zn-dependent oxidoreductase